VTNVLDNLEMRSGSKPIFASGERVRIAQHVANDPAAKVSSYIGSIGVVRFMLANEYGDPCEYVAVFWPHRAVTVVMHADAVELVS